MWIKTGLVVAGAATAFALGSLGDTVAAAEAPATGNPEGYAAVPPEARAENTSNPDIVIGTGTPGSCTSAAVVNAVAQGGIITFDCGPNPVVIEMLATAKVVNNTGPEIVIDGGGLVTLSGRNQRRILYMNTCDPAQVWTTSHCQNQDHPRLTVQNLTFVDADSTGESYDGGGAIWVRGGRFKVVNSRFFDNTCDASGPDVGGGAIRVFSQYNTQPVYVVNSTFDGNTCSNGGAINSIGVSWTIINSLFTDNEATGWGANPAQGGTPGGGNGGAIGLDGNTYTLLLQDTWIERNHAPEGGGAVFYVSNNRTGSLVIRNSVLIANPSDGFETNGYPGIFVLANGAPTVTGSLLDHNLTIPVGRLAGSNRYQTAAAIAQWAYPSGADVVYVATGLNFPDALAGGAAAASEGGPLLLVNTTSLPGATAAELSRLDPDRIVLLGGTGAIATSVESALSAYGTVERRAGADRYATAVEVSKGSFTSAATVYVASGDAFPDAMVTAPAAVAAGSPLLLVTRNSVPAVVVGELGRLGATDIVIVGGPSAVDDSVAAQLAAGGRSVSRISGSSRYATAAQLSSVTFGGGVPTVLVAVGTDYPDALAGAAVAGVSGGPVLLVESERVPGAAAAELGRLNPGEILLLGGAGAVSWTVGADLAAYE